MHDSRYLCPICGPRWEFDNEADLLDHIDERHPKRRYRSPPRLNRSLYNLAHPDSDYETSTLGNPEESTLPSELSSPVLKRNTSSFLRSQPTTSAEPRFTSPDHVVREKRPWYTDPRYQGPRTVIHSRDDSANVSSRGSSFRRTPSQRYYDTDTLEHVKQLRRELEDLTQRKMHIMENANVQAVVPVDSSPNDGRDLSWRSAPATTNVDRWSLEKQRKESNASLADWMSVLLERTRRAYVEAEYLQSRLRKSFRQTPRDTVDAPIPAGRVVSRKQTSPMNYKDKACSTDDSDAPISDAGVTGDCGIALLCVFSYLSCIDLLRCGQMNRLWRNVSHTPTLWRRVKLVHVSLSNELLTLISEWSSEVVEIELDSLSLISSAKVDKPTDDSESTGLLESSAEKLVQKNRTTLTSLRVRSCGELISERIVWLTQGYCKNLTVLEYSSSHDVIGPELMSGLKKGCPKLTEIRVAPQLPNNQALKFNDACCGLIGQGFASLKILCIGGKPVTTNGLVEISKGCRNLKCLELRYCSSISKPGAIRMTREGLFQLQEMTLFHTYITNGTAKQFLSGCPVLKKMYIVMKFEDYQAEKSVGLLAKSAYKKYVKDLQLTKTHAGYEDLLMLDVETLT